MRILWHQADGSPTETASKQSLPPSKQMRDYASGCVSQLTAEQKEAIHDYTKGIPPYYRNINSVLMGTQSNYDLVNEERCEFTYNAERDKNAMRYHSVSWLQCQCIRRFGSGL